MTSMTTAQPSHHGLDFNGRTSATESATGAGRRILILASNPAVSPLTGWAIGFWWAELTHPFFEFHEAGYKIEIASPRGGDLEGDGYSDPEDQSAYAADDYLSLVFKHSTRFAQLLKNTRSIADIRHQDFDALLVIGGQGPLVTMIDDAPTHQLLVDFHESAKVTGLICHGTCVLLKARLPNGDLLCKGRTWTGFADSEEAFAESYAGQKVQPFWIGREARAIPDTNYVAGPRFAPFAVRDGHLITGQQQFSGRAAAKLIIEALGR